MSRKWIIIGENAYLSCPCCSAFPMRDYGRDEYGNYLLQCRRCGILVVRKTQPTKLRKSALKRFWGEALRDKRANQWRKKLESIGGGQE